MPDNYDKYKLTRKVMGKTSLENSQHEAIADMLAHKVPHKHIMDEFHISDEQLQALLDDPMVQRRITYKIKVLNPKQPKTAEECLDFAKEQLVHLSRKARLDKDKVMALRHLGVIAISEKKENTIKDKNQSPPPIQVNMDLLDDLNSPNEDDAD